MDRIDTASPSYESAYQQQTPEWRHQVRALLRGDIRQIGPLLGKLRAVLRARWQLRGCTRVGSLVQVVGKVRVTSRGGAIVIGQRTRLRGVVAPCDLRVHTGGRIEIGEYCFINHGAEITAAKLVRIGHDCMLGPHCFLLDTNYHDLSNHRKPVSPQPIVIGNDVWLGARVIVLAGVTIGDGAVIGAGAVVTRDIPPRCLAVGNPAQVVRFLTEDSPDGSSQDSGGPETQSADELGG